MLYEPQDEDEEEEAQKQIERERIALKAISARQFEQDLKNVFGKDIPDDKVPEAQPIDPLSDLIPRHHIKKSESEELEDDEEILVKEVLDKIKLEEIENENSAYATAVWPMAIPMGKKNDAVDGVAEFVSRIQRAGFVIKRMHSDQALEFLAINMRRYLASKNIWQTYTAGARSVTDLQRSQWG